MYTDYRLQIQAKPSEEYFFFSLGMRHLQTAKPSRTRKANQTTFMPKRYFAMRILTIVTQR